MPGVPHSCYLRSNPTTLTICPIIPQLRATRTPFKCTKQIAVVVHAKPVLQLPLVLAVDASAGIKLQAVSAGGYGPLRHERGGHLLTVGQ